jgi:peptidoglycan/LPS O-acetylase OafA/YrhL
VTNARRRHLDEVDVVRLLTFAAVIVVHAVAFTEPPASRGWAGLLMLAQFGREVFFALTAFVLVYSAAGRPHDSGTFWRKRFPAVAVPYLAWSAIYSAFHIFGPLHAHLSPATVAWDFLTGNAEYHLYFLLVTLQLYLVFPLLLRFVRRTADRAVPVLATVGAINVAWLAWLQYGHAPAGWAGQFLWPRAYELLPTYGVYVLLGAYAALHLDRLEPFVARHRRRLLGVAAGAAVAAEAAFWAQVGGRQPRVAAAVLQPAMLLTSLAALIVLYLTGTAWVGRGRPGARLMTRASDLSFGVYLAHPLVLEVLLRLGLGNDGQRLPAPLATGLAMIGAGTGAILIAVVARRSRWTLALTGRPRPDRPVAAAPAAPDDARPTADAAGTAGAAIAYELQIRVTEGSQVGSRR